MVGARHDRRRTGRWITAAVSVVAAMALTGCGAAYDTPAAVELPAAITAPTYPTPQTQSCENDRSELATYPATPSLPTPGDMPAGTYMAEIKARGRLIVGTSIDTNLFAALNTENRFVGFDVDMARLVAHAIFGGDYKDIDNFIEYRGITYAQRIPTVASGEIDLIAHTMTINCARWQQVAFSRVYLHAGQKLLVDVDSDVRTIEELAGQRVCVSAGGTSADEMRGLELDDPIEVIEVDNQTDCVVLFQQGEADAIRSDDTVLAGFIAQDPFARLAGQPLTREPYGLATSLEHPEFTSFVNAVLNQAMDGSNANPFTDVRPRDGISEDVAPPSWQAIYDRWLLGPMGPPASDIVPATPENPDPQQPPSGVPTQTDYSRTL